MLLDMQELKMEGSEIQLLNRPSYQAPVWKVISALNFCVVLVVLWHRASPGAAIPVPAWPPPVTGSCW